MKLSSRILLAAATTLVAASTLQAANGADTWTGATAGDWNSTNWTGANTTPISGDSLVFGGSTPQTLTDTLTTATAFNIAGITFSSGSGVYTINGGTYTLNGGITNNSTALDSLNQAITVSGTQTITTSTGGGNLTLTGVLTGGASGGLTIAGAGTTTLTNASVVNSNGTAVFSNGVTVTNGGTLTWNLTANASTGDVSHVNLGTLNVQSGGVLNLINTKSVAFATNDALFNNQVLTGAGTINQTGGGTVDFWTGCNISGFSGTYNVVNGILSIQTTTALATTTATINLTATTGFLDLRSTNFACDQLTGSGIVGSSNASETLTVGTNNGSSTFSGVIKNGGIAGAGTGDVISLTKVGTGTFTLNGPNTYTGTTTLNGGTLLLDFTATGAPTTNIINNTANSSVLSLGGGTLLLNGKASTTNSQRFNGLSLAGGGTLNLAANANANPLLLSLGAITRVAGGTLDVILPTGTQGATNGVTTTSTTNDASSGGGMIGPWAFVGTGSGTTYAVISGGNIVAYTGGTAAANNSGLTDTTGTVNYNLAAASVAAPATVSANTILYTGAAGTTNGATSFTVNGLTNAGSGLWTIANPVIIGANKELVVNTASGDIAISGVIANNGAGASALTTLGTGTTTLTGANSYTGGTFVNQGMLQIGNGTTNGTVNGAYSLASGATLRLSYNASGAVAPTWANFTGAGTLDLATAKSFDTTWNTPSLGAGFTGTLQIDGGRVVGSGAAGQGLGGTTLIVVNNGGQFAIYNNGTVTQNFAIAGTGYGESGYESALRLGATGGTATLTGAVTLSASATIGAGNGGVGYGVLNGVISGASGATLTLGTSAEIGVVSLTGANTYTGATQVNFGTLNVTGSLASSVTVNSGATLTGTGVTTGNLTLATSSTLVGAVGTGVGSNGNVFTAVNVNTSAGGVNVSGVISASGTMDIVNFTGSWTGSTANFNLSGYRTGSTVSAVASAGAQKLQLQLATATDTWVPATGTWDNTQGLGVWNNSANQNDNKYYSGDAVVFNDLVGSTAAVTLNVIVTPGSLTFNNTTATSYTLSGTGGLSGNASLVKTGNGTVTLTTANTYVGGTTVSNGTLQVGNGGATGSISATSVTVASGATLAYNLSGAYTAAALSVAGNLAYTSAGALSFSGTYGGNQITATGANVNVTGALVLNAGAGGVTITGSSTGAAGITSGTSYNMTTTGNVTFTGTSTAGSFVDGISLAGTYTATSGTLTFDGTAGTAGAYGFETGVSGSWAGNINTFGNVVFKGTGGTTRNSDLNLGPLTGNGTVTLIGRSKGLNTVSTFTASGGAYNVIIQTTNGAGINGLLGSGTDTTGNGNYTVNSAAGVTFNGRTVNAGTGTISLTSGTGGYTISGNTTLTAATLTVNDTNNFAVASGATLTVNAAGSLSNIITGSGALTKGGAGTLILTGANSYTGKTTVSVGNLTVGSGGQIVLNAVGGVSVASGATLALSGTGIVKMSLATATLANAGTLTGSGTLNLNGLFDAYTTGQTYTLITGTTNNAGLTLNVTGYNSGTASFNNATGVISFTAVPEPSTYGLIGAGALAAVAFVRRRRKVA